jgi:NitT/TauT family transport system permease protein
MTVSLRQNPVAIAAMLVATGVLFWLMAGNVSGGVVFWLGVIVLWALAWALNSALASATAASPGAQRAIGLVVPAVFGITLLFLWELVVKGFHVPLVLLPAPSDIGMKLATSLPRLGADFVQTFMRAVLPGWLAGSLSGFVMAIVCDRVPFLKRGLLPLGNLVAALPMVGIAPIMVMWFGFDWPSKMAVVVIMTFFPMLVNAVVGLEASGHLERDLMRSYGAGYWNTLVKLRLPFAMPFVFNALKINSTLALIGAIVAEFFGTPIVGMGFRISTEVGRLGLDMVWAEIAVAAVAGSAFYGLIALVERAVTFWHPSYRSRR